MRIGHRGVVWLYFQPSILWSLSMVQNDKDWPNIGWSDSNSDVALVTEFQLEGGGCHLLTLYQPGSQPLLIIIDLRHMTRYDTCWSNSDHHDSHPKSYRHCQSSCKGRLSRSWHFWAWYDEVKNVASCNTEPLVYYFSNTVLFCIT